MSPTKSRTPRGPHYELADCNGPNAKSLKAAQLDPEIEREIDQAEQILDALKETELTTATPGKPAPDAENRADVAAAPPAAVANEYAWIETESIPGEPQAVASNWRLPGEDQRIADLRAYLSACHQKMRWLRRALVEAANQLKGAEQHSAEAKAIKAETVSILKELLPLAKRNAKRGKPALLRLITRAIKTKL